MIWLSSCDVDALAGVLVPSIGNARVAFAMRGLCVWLRIQLDNKTIRDHMAALANAHGFYSRFGCHEEGRTRPPPMAQASHPPHASARGGTHGGCAARGRPPDNETRRNWPDRD